MYKDAGTSAGLLALLAMAFHMAGPGAHEHRTSGTVTKAEVEQTSDSKSAEKTEAAGRPGPWLASRSFLYSGNDLKLEGDRAQLLNLSDSEAVARCAKDGECREQLRRLFGVGRGHHEYEFMLATVADPLRTRLTLTTDDSLNAIEEAAADDGWEFATQWLPWPGGAKGASAESSLRSESGAGLRRKALQPGLLVFRHSTLQPNTPGNSKPADESKLNPPSPRVLFVLLVGETPTGGINGLQFKMARAYMEALGGGAETPVRLLSPCFSASFYSLSELIGEDRTMFPGRSYLVRTGTATSEVGSGMLRALNGNGAKIVDFRGANEGMADQRNHFRQLLKRLHIPPSRAAYLIEGESAFGNEFARETTPQRAATKMPWTRRAVKSLRTAPADKPLALAVPPVKPDHNPAQSASSGEEEPIRTLRFPREISHLRNAYREALTQTAGENEAVPDVNFTLKDTGGGEDGVPLFSETQTPLSQNAVIQQIANEIRRNRIRIVEAGATNVLDLLFVSRVIREQCPDTRVVITFPDLLFVQAQQTESLSGILALSTYPLFFERERWMGDATTGVTFTDMNAEGLYNAAVILLNRDPVNGPQPADYGWMGQRHPPGWLLLLDRGGFSPVDALPGSASDWFEDRGETSTKSTKLMLPWPSRPWTLLVLVVSGTALLFCGVLVQQVRNPSFRFLEATALDFTSSADIARHFFLFSLVLTWAVAQLVLWLPWVFQDHEFSAPGLQFILALGSVSCLVAAGWILRVSLWRRRAKEVRMSVVVIVLVMAVVLGLWMYCSRPGNVTSFFFSFRSVEMQFGSSPMVPILSALGALMILAAVHLKRFQLISRQRPTIFTGAFDEGLKGALRKSRQEMNRVLALPCGMDRKEVRTKVALFIFVMALMFIILQVPVNLASIDGTAYDILCISLQGAVVVALLLTCWQIRSAWSWFHLFLTSLRTLPLAGALVRVTEAGHTGPIWTRRLNLLSLEIPIESAKTLHDMLLIAQKKRPKGLALYEVEKWYLHYREAVQMLLNAETSTPPLKRLEITRRFFKLKFRGAMISNRIAKCTLLPHWRESRIAMQIAECEEEGKKGSEPTFEDLAERFVALHMSVFALYAVRHIQNLMWFLSLGFVLLVFSLNSYHFQSPEQIGRFLIALFVVLGYVTWRCMVGMERNTILSRIAGTGEGELNKGFYLKLLGYGALPLIGLLATQFPSISKFLFSWVQPALEAMK